uniref:Uncharacterized protein n=1 Tax=Ditylenchus dipsaci TaxID=166011 RepID=A0A915EKU1_9BILA
MPNQIAGGWEFLQRSQDALNSFTVINALQDDKVPTPVAEVVVMEENVAKKDAQIDGRDEVIVSEDHEVIVLHDFE